MISLKLIKTLINILKTKHRVPIRMKTIKRKILISVTAIQAKISAEIRPSHLCLTFQTSSIIITRHKASSSSTMRVNSFTIIGIKTNSVYYSRTRKVISIRLRIKHSLRCAMDPKKVKPKVLMKVKSCFLTTSIRMNLKILDR